MVAVVRSLRRNLSANFLSRAWIGVVQIATLPYLLRILGPEGFGLVGVFVTLQAIANIFETSFSVATNREIAQQRVDDPSATGSVLQFHAIAGIGCGVLIAIAVCLLAPLLASYWITSDAESRPIIVHALVLMGCAVGVQIAGGSPFGALLGCDRQISANVVLALWATLRTAGALAALVIWGGGVLTYFVVQLGGLSVYAIVTLILAARATRWIFDWPDFRVGDVRHRIHTVGGMIGSGLIGTPLNQLDKIALAHWGGLAELGYYTFASNLAAVVLYVAGPVVQASFPALAASVGSGDKAETGHVFHLMTELITVMTGVIALALSLFGRDIVGLWTGNGVTGAAVGELLPYLMIGAAVSAINYLPHNLQLATGRTRPLVIFNAIALIAMAPTMCGLVIAYGAVGAASGWLAIKVAFLVCVSPIILRPLVAGGASLWWRTTILPPLLGLLPGLVLGRALIPSGGSTAGLVAGICLATLVSLAGGVLAAARLRRQALLVVQKWI